MNLQHPKSRWKESEWWLTVTAMLLGILIKAGVISTSQGQVISDMTNDVVALILIVAPVLGWQFIRTKKKIAERDQDAKVEEAKIIGKANVKVAQTQQGTGSTRRTIDPPEIK